MVPAMLCFTAGTLIVSSIHDELFSADDAADLGLVRGVRAGDARAVGHGGSARRRVVGPEPPVAQRCMNEDEPSA